MSLWWLIIIIPVVLAAGFMLGMLCLAVAFFQLWK